MHCFQQYLPNVDIVQFQYPDVYMTNTTPISCNGLFMPTDMMRDRHQNQMLQL